MVTVLTYEQWIAKLISDLENRRDAVEFGKWVFKLKQDARKDNEKKQQVKE